MRPAARVALGLIALAGAAWLGFAAWRLLAAGPLAPNALAGDVTQSGAALVLVASSLVLATRAPWRRAWTRRAAVALAAPLVASVAIGMPWSGVAPSPLVAVALGAGVLLLASERARTAGAALVLVAWAAHATRLVLAAEHAWELEVALVSHALPSLLLLGPALVLAHCPRAEPRATGAWPAG